MHLRINGCQGFMQFALGAVDHEGGRVQRFRDGFTSLPAAAHFGQVYEQDPNQARHLAEIAGWLMAVELRAVGIDFSFAPVLDVDHGVSEVIGDRAFHSDPAVVTELARAYIKGMHEAGMAATGKHFPGHGCVAADSHTDIPVDEREYNDIYAHDILPFKRLVHQGLAAIMPAHVIYESLDPLPACFSSFWLKTILRERLGFDGLIVSDDLTMAGAAAMGSYVERAQAALEAGCDVLSVCNNREGLLSILDVVEKPYDDNFERRLANYGRFLPC